MTRGAGNAFLSWHTQEQLICLTCGRWTNAPHRRLDTHSGSLAHDKVYRSGFKNQSPCSSPSPKVSKKRRKQFFFFLEGGNYFFSYPIKTQSTVLYSWENKGLGSIQILTWNAHGCPLRKSSLWRLCVWWLVVWTCLLSPAEQQTGKRVHKVNIFIFYIIFISIYHMKIHILLLNSNSDPSPPIIITNK